MIETRQRIGDWKGGLITGRVNQSAIGTLVDRTSRYVRPVHLPDAPGADRPRRGPHDRGS